MDNKKPRRTPKVFVEDSNQQHKSKKEIIGTLIKKKTRDKFLSESQREYYEILQNNQITICSGPAGVGKSYISMKAAVDLLADPNNSYEKLIIVRPAVEAEEKLGSLPGNVEEKLDPYIFPSYYLLNKIIGKDVIIQFLFLKRHKTVHQNK
jgi:phosphate starvation-inducible PhoH-like protein